MLEVIKQAYRKAGKRILFMDYDGTIVSFTKTPEETKIGEDTRKILEDLSSDLKNTLVIISGRDMRFLENQFHGLTLILIAEHGYRIKEIMKPWDPLPYIDLTWKDRIRKFLQGIVITIPGSFLEEKEVSLAFHYRNVDKEIYSKFLSVIKEKIKVLLTEYPYLELLEGNNVVEVKVGSYNKGTVAATFLKKTSYDFILAAGDDVTDETLFRELNEKTFTIKIGEGKTHANYKIDDPSEFMIFLSELVNIK
jgi:trehalose 6-phosphate synthase/phosphatase